MQREEESIAKLLGANLEQGVSASVITREALAALLYDLPETVDVEAEELPEAPGWRIAGRPLAAVFGDTAECTCSWMGEPRYGLNAQMMASRDGSVHSGLAYSS